MTLIFNESTYIAGIWHVPAPNAVGNVRDASTGRYALYRGADWSAWLWRQLEEDMATESGKIGRDHRKRPYVWTVTCRFRYYRGNEVFERSRDIRSWYKAQLNPLSEKAAIAAVQCMAKEVAKPMSASVSYLSVGGNGLRLVDVLKSRKPSWSHMITVEG